MTQRAEYLRVWEEPKDDGPDDGDSPAAPPGGPDPGPDELELPEWEEDSSDLELPDYEDDPDNWLPEDEPF